MPTSTFEPGSVAVVLGTRPEIVKLGHVIRLLGPAASIVHTGQHYEDHLSSSFFTTFALPEPIAHIGVGGTRRGAQIGAAVAGLDDVLAGRDVEAVVVQGDTNAALAGALAANALEIPLVHVEAGLRSFDRRMPEEHNRVIADHLGDLLCAPTEVNRDNLLAEGIPDARITVTGNTVVEAVLSLLPAPRHRAPLLDEHGLKPGGFVLSTFHRPENVDEAAVLASIIDQLTQITIPVVLPLHPRTRQRLAEAGLLEQAATLTVTDPMGYEPFLALAAESALLVSDSGGLQEEASVLKRPIIVVRRSTERPEVIGTFAERVEPGGGIAELAADWLKRIDDIHEWLASLPSPYGDGTASERTVSALETLIHG